jgi:Peptidase S24-like
VSASTAIDVHSSGGVVLSDSDSRTFAAIRGLLESGDEVWLVVTGSSMKPTLNPGDRVLLARHQGGSFAGRIVFADCGGRPVLHRVVAHRERRFLTAGDGCLVTDIPITRSEIVAQAEAVYSAGGVAALRPTIRFGVAAFARYVLLEARALLYRLWRRTRYRRSLPVWIWGSE